jgi:hypothetical protein
VANDAVAILDEVKATLMARAADNDVGDKERLMERIVHIFTVITGKDMSEEEGWLFMVSLKLARLEVNKSNRDNWIDAIGYMALLGEYEEKEVEKRETKA